MISQHHFNSTFSLATAQALQVWANANLITDNPYLEQVDIPVFDAGKNSHSLITESNGNWNEANLNSSTIKHFYIEPGNYTEHIELTRSGTETDRRTLSLYDANDAHPGTLAESNQANATFDIDASYWTVSRLSQINKTATTPTAFTAGVIALGSNATHNIFDSLYQTECPAAFSFRKGATHNTIQKCYFDGTEIESYERDIAQIELASGGLAGDTLDFTYNKFVLNESRNFKLLKFHDVEGSEYTVDFTGCVVSENVQWCDSDVYCDNDGTLNVNGDYSRVESGMMGFKSGGWDANNPIIVDSNAIWGSKPTWDNPLLSAPAPGLAIVYYDTRYVQFTNNIAIGTPGGIALTRQDSLSNATQYCRAIGNILVGCGIMTGSAPTQSFALRSQGAKDAEVRDNLVKDPRGAWAQVSNNAGLTLYFGENDVVNIDTGIEYDGTGTVTGMNPTDTNNYLDTAAGDIAYPYNYTIHYMKYTSTPQTKVEANVLKIEQT